MTPNTTGTRPKSRKAKTIAENVGLQSFTVSAPVPSAVIIDIKTRKRIKLADLTVAEQIARLQKRIDDLTDKSAGLFGVWTWKREHGVSNGYPRIGYRDPWTGKQRTREVHRLLMELKLGRPLERHEYVLHDRGSPKTDVNPAHLRIGTQQENLDDAKAEGRLRGKLDVKSILKIDRLFHKDGVEIADIAYRFGVSNNTVSAIVRGKTHSDKTGRVYEPKKVGRPAKRRLKVEKQLDQGAAA